MVASPNVGCFLRLTSSRGQRDVQLGEQYSRSNAATARLLIDTIIQGRPVETCL